MFKHKGASVPNTKPLVIYHGNRVDGFAAAWVFRKLHGEGNVDFHAGTYGEQSPDVTGRIVFVVDFPYKRSVLEQMRSVAYSVIVIDHHKTAQQDLDGLDGVIFDMTKSGAVLAHEYCFPEQPVPQLLLHIQDRDLWKFELPQTRDILAALFSYPYDFAAWDTLMPDGEIESSWALTQLALDGSAIERKHHKDVAELVNVSKRWLLIGGHRALAANMPYMLSSIAGHILIEHGSPFGACYFDRSDCRVFSLRSTDAGLDVSEIAKQYGGGGHRNAAGFKVAFADATQFELPST